MAGWLTALKLVPWGKVIEATPQITKAAKELLNNRRKPAPVQPTGVTPLQANDGAGALLQLQQQMVALQEQQRASALLLESLAEQNAQLVQTVSTLRLRSRWMMAGLLLLAAAVVARWVAV